MIVAELVLFLLCNGLYWSRNNSVSERLYRVEAARVARSLGLGLNVGHDLSLENLQYLHEQIPWVDEASIGHALICDALYMGLQQTILAYKKCLS